VKPAALAGERLWRVRKNHLSIDAQLHPAAGGSAVDLRFFYDGDLILTTRLRSRSAAEAEASRRLRELQRAGWTVHW
jgi:hypothetical protein